MTAQQKRQQILEAAAQEFVERGYAAATLSSVAGRLGLTKGALAHHFPTKDELLSGLGEQLSQAIEDSDRVTRAAFPNSGIHAAVAYLVQLSAIAAKNVCVAS
ncbi:MAG: TetR family transcriptional regulator, partial [Microbacteriaceae bacterium]